MFRSVDKFADIDKRKYSETLLIGLAGDEHSNPTIAIEHTPMCKECIGCLTCLLSNAMKIKLDQRVDDGEHETIKLEV